MNKGALRVLSDANATVVCVNPVGPQAAHRRIKQNTVQLAPVDADLRQGVTGVAPPGLAKFPDLRHSFIHVTRQPALLQGQCKTQARDAAARHRDTASSNHSGYSAVMPLRRMTSPQRG